MGSSRFQTEWDVPHSHRLPHPAVKGRALIDQFPFSDPSLTNSQTMLERGQNFHKRWQVYLDERFPIRENVPRIIILSLAAVGYSVSLRGPVEGVSPFHPFGAAIIAGISVFIFFLQLQIVQEFQDFEHDFRYHPERPVPRGVITLKELGTFVVASAMVQLGLTLALDIVLLLLLLPLWGYLSLLVKGFYAHNWLKAHVLIDRLSRRAIIPLIALYATACDWLPAGITPSIWGLFWFAMVSFALEWVVELGSHIRAPRNEVKGIRTYSALWGRKTAIRVWLGTIWVATLTTLLAAAHIRFMLPISVLTLFLLTLAVIVAWRFWFYSTSQWAMRLRWVSQTWMLAIYLGLGVLPIVLKGFTR